MYLVFIQSNFVLKNINNRFLYFFIKKKLINLHVDVKQWFISNVDKWKFIILALNKDQIPNVSNLNVNQLISQKKKKIFFVFLKK